MVTALAATVLGAWLAATVVRQSNGRLSMWLAAHDPFHLIPRWRFFDSADPRAIAVEIRDRLDAAPPTPWERVPRHAELRWYAAVWSSADLRPDVRVSLAERVADVARRSGGDVARVSGSWAHQALVRDLASLDPCGCAGRRQFRLVQLPIDGDTAPVVYESALFDVAGVDGS